jgi:hypothetical protein
MRVSVGLICCGFTTYFWKGHTAMEWSQAAVLYFILLCLYLKLPKTKQGRIFLLGVDLDTSQADS